MSILLTNDDGIRSIGLTAMKKELEKISEVEVVAPSEERSWIAKAVTRSTIRCKKVRMKDGSAAFSVKGTPADCVRLAIYHILERKPELVVSGINLGHNMGDSFVLSSGTVGAALESAISGIPSAAISLDIPNRRRGRLKEGDFRAACGFASRLARHMLLNGIDRGVSSLIMNVPYGASEKTRMKLTRLARYDYKNIFIPGRGKFLHVHRPVSRKQLEKGTDMHAVFVKKHVSITPVQMDLTARAKPKKLIGWLKKYG